MKQLGLIAVGPESPVALMHVTVEGGGISAVASCVPEESTVAMIVVPSSPAKLVHAMLTSVTATNAFMAHPPWVPLTESVGNYSQSRCKSMVRLWLRSL